MKKLLGYIPVEPGTANTGDAIVIRGKKYIEAEVWVPGLMVGTDLYDKTHFKPKEGEEKYNGNACANCGKRRLEHKGPDSMCPAKDEKTIPGIKYD